MVDAGVLIGRGRLLEIRLKRMTCGNFAEVKFIFTSACQRNLNYEIVAFLEPLKAHISWRGIGNDKLSCRCLFGKPKRLVKNFISSF
jgi:hypothetical protein